MTTRPSIAAVLLSLACLAVSAPKAAAAPADLTVRIADYYGGPIEWPWGGITTVVLEHWEPVTDHDFGGPYHWATIGTYSCRPDPVAQLPGSPSSPAVQGCFDNTGTTTINRAGNGTVLKVGDKYAVKVNIDGLYYSRRSEPQFLATSGNYISLFLMQAEVRLFSFLQTNPNTGSSQTYYYLLNYGKAKEVDIMTLGRFASPTSTEWLAPGGSYARTIPAGTSQFPTYLLLNETWYLPGKADNQAVGEDNCVRLQAKYTGPDGEPIIVAATGCTPNQ